MNTCPHCGSDDLEVADNLMAEFQGEMMLWGVPPMHLAEEASQLRAPHFNGECKVAQK